MYMISWDMLISGAYVPLNVHKWWSSQNWSSFRSTYVNLRFYVAQYSVLWVVFCISICCCWYFILFLFGHCIVCPSFWSLYCLPFFLVTVLSALLFGHCIVCPSQIYGFWLHVHLWNRQTFLNHYGSMTYNLYYSLLR